MESNENNNQPSHSEAMSEVSMLEQRAQVMGANDYEPSHFKQIKEQLSAGDITSTEAVARARAIVEGKQDYH